MGVLNIIMSYGLPDYYRGMDVAYQELSEVIVRPKFGGGQLLSGSKEVEAGTVTVLAFKTGKGMVYAGNVWLDATNTQANSEVQLYVDGKIITTLSFLRLNEYGIVKPRSSVVTLNRYDAVKHIYSVGISYGVTFETYLMILYSEKYDRKPTVHYRLVYALL